MLEVALRTFLRLWVNISCIIQTYTQYFACIFVHSKYNICSKEQKNIHYNTI